MNPKTTVGLVTGCFDLLHPGHIKFLRFAASCTDKLIVGLESDIYISEHKGPTRPVFKASDRKLIISELKSVASVFIIPSHPDYQKLLKRLKTDYLIISRKDNLYKVKHQICQNLGVKLIIYPQLPRYSTTALISIAQKSLRY